MEELTQIDSLSLNIFFFQKYKKGLGKSLSNIMNVLSITA